MTTHRPLGVRLIAFIVGINGLLSIVAGVLLLSHVGEETALEVLDVSKGNLNAVAISAIVIGLITMISAGALRSGSNFARLLLVVLWLGQAGFLVYAIVALHSVHWTSAMWPTVILGLTAVYLLLDKDARDFFSTVKG
jgi:hypothetical protein